MFVDYFDDVDDVISETEYNIQIKDTLLPEYDRVKRVVEEVATEYDLYYEYTVGEVETPIARITNFTTVNRVAFMKRCIDVFFDINQQDDFREDMYRHHKLTIHQFIVFLAEKVEIVESLYNENKSLRGLESAISSFLTIRGGLTITDTNTPILNYLGDTTNVALNTILLQYLEDLHGITIGENINLLRFSISVIAKTTYDLEKKKHNVL